MLSLFWKELSQRIPSNVDDDDDSNDVDENDVDDKNPEV